LTILVVLTSASSLWSFSPDDEITAKAALLMDAATGRILFQKYSDQRLPPEHNQSDDGYFSPGERQEAE
jgi:D-alanyl-D-alanine carboxypeptidase